MSDEAPKIVGLDGKAVEPPGEVNAGVVDLLERILAAARKGEIDGVAVCYTSPIPGEDDHTFLSAWHGPKITLLGAMTRQLYALNKTLDYRDTGHVFTGDER